MAKYQLKVNMYEVVTRAIESGIDYGYMRSFKHTDNPNEETIKENIRQAVMNELCEVIDWNQK